ncbi:MAG: Na+/H+ antiporter NhaA [Dongiaceae bacterium]
MTTPLSFFRRFFAQQSASGILLILATLAALILANSALAPDYHAFLESHAGALSIRDWINDGLMVIFFLVVGLEIKREFRQGELADLSRASLPLVAAFGGMLAPALIYLGFTHNHPELWRGWAIPSATDIAFAVGILALLGNRVPHSLKLFLVALAIADDLGAVLVIALFYTNHLNFDMLFESGFLLLLLLILHDRRVEQLWVYLAVGLLLWISVLHSGIHPTIAGVALAFMIPLRNKEGDAEKGPLIRLEKALHPYSVFLIMPLFALANAGVNLESVNETVFLHPVMLAIAFGLALGKPLGIVGAAALAIRLRLSVLPPDITRRQLWGVGALGGIGFTMSLFIATLAFPQNGMEMVTRLGILIGSLFSAVLGYWLLCYTKK